MKKLLLMVLLSSVMGQGLEGAGAGAPAGGGGAGGAWVRGYGPDAEFQRCGSCEKVLPADDGAVAQSCGHNLCQTCVVAGKECQRHVDWNSLRKNVKRRREMMPPAAKQHRVCADAAGASVAVTKHCDKCNKDIAEENFAVHAQGYGEYACADCDCSICIDPLGAADKGPVWVRNECGHVLHSSCAFEAASVRVISQSPFIVEPGFVCVGCNKLNQFPSNSVQDQALIEVFINALNNDKDLKQLQTLLNGQPPAHQSVLVFLRGAFGHTMLHLAAKYARKDIVIELLNVLSDTAQRMALVQIPDENGQTALYYATFEGHTAIVAALLNAFPDDAQRAMLLQKPDLKGKTVLHFAATTGMHDIVTELLNAIPDAARRTELVQKTDFYGMTALYWATYYGNSIIADKLLNSVPDAVQRAVLVQKPDLKGNTVLHWAAYAGWYDIVVALLKAVSDDAKRAVFAKMVDEDGQTALHCASSSGRHDIVAALLEAIPDVAQRAAFVQMVDDDGKTALDCVASRGRTGVVALLAPYATAGDGAAAGVPAGGAAVGEAESGE